MNEKDKQFADNLQKRINEDGREPIRCTLKAELPNRNGFATSNAVAPIVVTKACFEAALNGSPEALARMGKAFAEALDRIETVCAPVVC